MPVGEEWPERRCDQGHTWYPAGTGARGAHGANHWSPWSEPLEPASGARGARRGSPPAERAAEQVAGARDPGTSDGSPQGARVRRRSLARTCQTRVGEPGRRCPERSRPAASGADWSGKLACLKGG
jgi:hypothetical protein